MNKRCLFTNTNKVCVASIVIVRCLHKHIVIFYDTKADVNKVHDAEKR